MPPPKVFISYSHKDEVWKDRLTTHLGVLENQGLLQTWDDQRIGAGREWHEEIRKALDDARVAVFLISADSLTSKFFLDEEITRLLERRSREGVAIFPVVVRACAWNRVDWLAHMQVQPRHGKPLADFHGNRRDRELTKIAEEILDLLESPAVPSYPLHTNEIWRPADPAPRLHNLPFGRLGNFFKGRDKELRKLGAAIEGQGHPTAMVQQAIHGLGGIGKTRLAVEYAWRYGHRYTAALFVRAESRESLHAGLAALARADLLNLPERQTQAEDETVAAVLRWLGENPGWLLILDSVDTEEAVLAANEILPRLETGHVLLTSRRRLWPPEIQMESLDTLAREEATQLLLDRTAKGRTPAPDDSEQALRLAERLDGLPLALEQAAAYIVHHQTSFAKYLESWQRESDEVLSWYDPTVMKYPASLAVTWEKTFHHLGLTASAILHLSSYIAPDPIPEDMFEKNVSLVEEAIGLLSDERTRRVAPQSVKNAFSEMEAYSIITRQEGTFTVHRMVQEVVRVRIPGRRREWINKILKIVDQFVPGDPNDVRTWPVWDLLRPHVGQVIKYAIHVGLTDPTWRLLAALGALLHAKSLYTEAEPLMRQALEIEETLFGPNHPRASIHLNNLAQLLQDTNRLAEAERLMRRALEIEEASFGPENPRVTTHLSNLAQLLMDTNRLAEAEPLMRRALDIDEASYGHDHPRVAIHLNNLAQLLSETNRLAEAEPLMRRALIIDEAAFGRDHPNIAIRLNNLAQLFQATNRLRETEPLMRRALEIGEASYGRDHPNVASFLSNLAQLLQDTNRLAEAEALMRRALDIDEASFGHDHPSVATDLNNLAQLLRATNRLSEAELLLRRALAIDEASFGPDHPRVAIDLNNLAWMLQSMNRLMETELLMRRAIEIFEKHLGPDHPNTRIGRRNLELLLEADDRSSEL